MTEHHPTTPTTYFVVFAALLALTATTVLVAYAPLGHWHTPAALAIAVVKAALVLLYFMHLIHSDRLTWLVAAGAILWLGILLALTLADYLTRDWLVY